MKKGTKMTDEQRQHLSEAVHNYWENKEHDLKYGARRSDDSTTYMRSYMREYYEKNKEKWHTYTMERKYNDMTTEALLKLREKHIKGPVASDEKRQRLINIIEKVLIARGALTVECDFEHNYTTKTTAEIFKDGLPNYIPDIEVQKPHKPNKIEIDGVWYDLIECPIQWEG